MEEVLRQSTSLDCGVRSGYPHTSALHASGLFLITFACTHTLVRVKPQNLARMRGLHNDLVLPAALLCSAPQPT